MFKSLFEFEPVTHGSVAAHVEYSITFVWKIDQCIDLKITALFVVTTCS